MAKTKLKLFVWHGFSPDWTSGMAFAIAEDETEARKLVKEDYGGEPYEWGDLTIRRLDWRYASSISGGG